MLEISVNKMKSTNPFEMDDDEEHVQLQRTRLEDSMLDSTRRALGLLVESEDVGTRSAAELVEQGQALERISNKLTQADSTLSETQRNITALKSPFAGLGSKFLGKLNPKRNRQASSNNKEPSALEKYIKSGGSGALSDSRASTASLPVLHGPSTTGNRSATKQSAISNANDQNRMQSSAGSAREIELEGNLDTMSKYLTNLKGLAINMGDEIDRQNEFIIGIKESSEKVDVKMTAQRDALQKILKK